MSQIKPQLLACAVGEMETPSKVRDAEGIRDAEEGKRISLLAKFNLRG